MCGLVWTVWNLLCGSSVKSMCLLAVGVSAGHLVGRCESGSGPAWLWFTFQTTCRLLELAMGCFMASVTKQPVSGPQSGYLHHHYAAGLRLKRESLYL